VPPASRNSIRSPYFDKAEKTPGIKRPQGPGETKLGLKRRQVLGHDDVSPNGDVGRWKSELQLGPGREGPAGQIRGVRTRIEEFYELNGFGLNVRIVVDLIDYDGASRGNGADRSAQNEKNTTQCVHRDTKVGTIH
jgi:hypothetical protein